MKNSLHFLPLSYVLLICLCFLTENAHGQHLIFSSGNQLYSWAYQKGNKATEIYTAKKSISLFSIDTVHNQLLLNEEGRIRFLSLPEMEESYATDPYLSYYDQLPVFSPSGKYYALLNYYQVEVYQSKGNILLREVKLPDAETYTLTGFSDEDRILLSTSNKVFELNIATREIEMQLDHPHEYFKPVVSGDRSAICFYEEYSYDSLPFFIYYKGKIRSYTIPLGIESFSKTEVFFAEGTNDQLLISSGTEVLRHDLQTGQTKKAFSTQSPIKSAWPGNGNLLAVFHQDNSWNADTALPYYLGIYDREGLQNYQLPPIHDEIVINQAVFVPSFNQMAKNSGKSEPPVQMSLQRQIDLHDIYYSDKGNFIVTTATDNKLTLWDTRSLRQLRQLPCKKDVWSKRDIQIVEEDGLIGCICTKGYDDEVLRFFDLNSGRMVREIEPSEILEGFSLQEGLYFTQNDYMEEEALLVWHSDDTSPEYTIPQNLQRIKYHEKNQWLVGVLNFEEIAFYEKGNKKPFTKIKVDSKAEYINDFEVSADGKKLLVQYPFEGSVWEGGFSRWEVFDIESGEKLLSGEQPYMLNEVTFSNDSKSLFFFHYIDSLDNKGYNFIALVSQSLTDQKYTIAHPFQPGIGGSNNLAMHPVMDKAIFSNHYQLLVYNTRSGKMEKYSPEGIAEEYTRLSLYNLGKNAVLRNDKVIHLIDFQYPQNYSYIKPESKYGQIYLAGGPFWITEDTAKYREEGADYWINYRLRDARDLSSIVEFSHENGTLSEALMSDQSTLMFLSFMESEEYRLSLYNTNSQTALAQVFLESDELNTVALDELLVTADGQYVLLPAFDKDGNDEVRLYDLKNNLHHAHTIQGVLRAFPTQQQEVFITEKVNKSSMYDRDYYVYDLKTGVDIRLLGTVREGLKSLAISENNQYVLGTYKNRFIRFPLDAEGKLEAVQTHSFDYPLGSAVSGNSFIVYGYNKLAWYDINTMKEQYRLTGSAKSGALAQLPTGEYFVLSGNRPDYINYVVGDKAYPFDQFDLQNNRPDKVIRNIGFAPNDLVKLYENAYQKRLRKMNITNLDLDNDATIPEVTIDLNQIPLLSSHRQLHFFVTASDTSNPITRVNVWVNNVPVFGSDGLKIKTNSGLVEEAISLTLSEGRNQVKVSCHNSLGMESLKETFEVNFEPYGKKKPTLYLVAISVSKYRDSLYNLNYAAKDGRDIAALFSSDLAKYEEVVLDTLLNEAATRENILALKQRFLNTSVDDQVVLFLAGHGVLDNKYDFWFATHDMDFENPSKRGVGYTELEWLLDSIPARKKLLLMDACHSGEVDKEAMLSASNSKGEVGDYVVAQSFKRASLASAPQMGLQNSFEMMQELFVNLNYGSGSHVVSAAAGNSYAYEMEKYRNGVFTYAVLSGLNDQLADQNSDGQVTVSELQDYVGRQVEELTNGAQKPTSRQANLEFDFVVW